MTPEISVVIPAYCTAQRYGTSRLRLTLAGFARQTLDPSRYEVVVVDDGSDVDLRAELDPGEQPFALLVLRREHEGMCSAYNAGVAAAAADVILLGIDDNVPAPDALARHVALHRAHEGGDVVVCGRERFLLFAIAFRDPIAGELDADALRVQPGIAELPELRALRERGIRLEDVRDRFDELARLSAVLPASADIERTVAAGGFRRLSGGWLAMRLGNHSLRRELLEAAGGLDERLDPSGFYADNELGLRLRDHGADLVYDVEALMLHLSHGREAGFHAASLVNHARFLDRHPRLDVALLPHAFSLSLSIEEFSAHLDALAQEARA